MTTRFAIRRVYEEPADDDGVRVLVDRLWPRGLSREGAKLDEWAKDLAPTTELRKWFDHDDAKFDEFRTRYLVELTENRTAVEAFLEMVAGKKVTLLYGAKSTTCNQAVILCDFLTKRA